MRTQVLILTFLVIILGVIAKDFSSAEAEVQNEVQDSIAYKNIIDKQLQANLDSNRKKKPGKKSGRKSGKKPKRKPGKKPNKKPGKTTGKRPGKKPSKKPGKKPGKRPGKKPGKKTTTTPTESVIGECTTDWLKTHSGIRYQGDIQSNRIIGGKNVTWCTLWPWTASLRITPSDPKPNQKSVKCGGVLISCEHILTAQHCLYAVQNGKIDKARGVLPPKSVSISLGSTEYMYGSEFKGKVIYYKKTGFVPETDHCWDDIAVIQMDEKIDIRSGIRPILLPINGVTELENNNNDRTNEFFVTGWGLTPEKTNKLKETNNIKLRPGKVCSLTDDLKENYICMQRFPNEEPLAALCQGDSGSPGMVEDKQKWYVQAVISLNVGNCTDDGYGAMTNVFSINYREAIEKIIEGGPGKPEGWTKLIN